MALRFRPKHVDPPRNPGLHEKGSNKAYFDEGQILQILGLHPGLNLSVLLFSQQALNC